MAERAITDPFNRLGPAQTQKQPTLEELVERRKLVEQQEVEERLRGRECPCPTCEDEDRARRNWY